MRVKPAPTRAEVSDIANAVIDGVDAVLLSDDIPHGVRMKQAMTVLKDVIDDTELQGIQVGDTWEKRSPPVHLELDAVAKAAYDTASRVGAKAIVCVTHQGNTALKLSSFRPDLPIIAVTFNESVSKKMSIVRGVEGYALDVEPNIDQILEVVNQRMVNDSWLQQGDCVLFVSVTLSPISQTGSNLFAVQRL